MSASDDATRAIAIDPRESCIVEAPAGSGKTELLTQRFLSLLGSVELPEQIVAITFTRKAAAEMRERVVTTLRAAAESDPDVPPHRVAAVELARRALARSAAQGWSLQEQTQRLKILTIDALNTSLARQLPLLTSGIVSVDVTDNADRLYRLAARRTTEVLGNDDALGAALRRLLHAADNSLARLESWLAGALPQRDRWLRLLAAEADGELVGTLESRLARLERAADASLARLAGSELEARLRAFLSRRGGDDTACWREAAALLLTAKGEWRRRFTKAEGIPAGDKALKAELEALLEALQSVDGLHAALAARLLLPPAALEREQVEVLEALPPVLKHLLAELAVAFAEARSVDHTELALAAAAALGAVDAPSDLLLALDRRIEHILVDEFQDTSHLQWGLLERLTAGWEAGDGRSLFLVGDPMQSIYRFRDADLSLFLRAANEGLGEVRLRSLALRVNYRSAPTLVDWVNVAFAAASPGFRTAQPGRDANEAAGVQLHALTGGDYADEIARVVVLARAESERQPQQSIGILVRSRRHLIGLRAALAGVGLAAHAVEIDSLTDTSLGQDLIALTRALLHEADRLAWLAVLRAPWCGLGWADLEALCGGEREATIPSLLADPAALERLKPAGRARARWLAERLRVLRRERAGASLGRYVRAGWLLLDGPAALASQAEIDLAEQYCRDLDRLATAGDLDDPAQLLERFGRPSGGETPGESGIEIMTIHRAKGLEFDTVILPGLSRITRGNDGNLLQYQDINLENGERLSLLAAAATKSDPHFAWLRGLEREHEGAERMRLFYVAATRARERLHLVASLADAESEPPAGSLLATLWAGIGPGVQAAAVDAGDADAATAAADTVPAAIGTFVELPLRRLAFDPANPPSLPGSGDDPDPGSPRPEFEWVHPASVQVGTLIHRELQRLAEAASLVGAPVPPAIDTARYARELALLGVDHPDLGAAAGRVAAALERVWQHDTGRWLLAPRAEAWSEYRLTLRTDNRLEHVQIDRCFVEDGVFWIVDYKSGRHLGADTEAFLASEVERYRAQLERYAAAVAANDSRPIRVALYFPLMRALRDWSPAGFASRA